MKRFLIPLIISFTLIISGLGLYSWWRVNSSAVSSESGEVNFLILKGRSASQIGEKLYKEGLIKSPLAFKIYIQVAGKTKRVQAGEFRLSPNLSLSEIVDRLIEGPVELWLTIPEGLRREEIVGRFTEGLEMSLDQTTVFRQEFLKESEGKEGYLFPDTYLFPRDTSASLVVKKLSQTFEQRTKFLDNQIPSSEYSLSELITLASIIERETREDEERPIVAGILLKRLKAGWPLQVDATLQYAVASANCKTPGAECEWWPILTKDNLEINSPYNSYKFTGLPPFPIANPGLSSIKAVVDPQDSPYWFYIHDSNGKIHFAETVEEHNQNIRKYLGK